MNKIIRKIINVAVNYLKLNHIFGNSSYKEKIKTIAFGRFIQVIFIIIPIIEYKLFHIKSSLSIYINSFFIIYALYSIPVFIIYKCFMEKTDDEDAGVQIILYLVDLFSTVFVCGMALKFGHNINLLP